MSDSVWGGKGRPSPAESQRRYREFLRVLSATGSFDQAIRASGMSTKRLPQLLDSPAFRAVCMAVMDEAEEAQAA